MKKLICMLLAMLLVVSMFAGCASDAKTNNTSDTTNNDATNDTTGDTTGDTTDDTTDDTADPLKVIYLVNGSLGDKGFYDSAASGIAMIEDQLGAETKIVEMGRDETTYESNFLDVSEQDWSLITCGTFSVKELAEDIALQFPEKNYLAFDVSIDFEKVTTGNMLGLGYYSNQGAFLAGALAAKMLLESGDARIDASQKTLGFIGPMDTTGINDFLVGYLEGIKYVDPEIKVLTSYVGSFEDVTKCMEMTTQLYNQGAQIVYAPASQSILGAATAASNANKYLIACDQDLYSQLVESDPAMAEIILTSSLKNVGESIFTAVKSLQDGTMEMGQNYTLGLDSGAVGLAKNDNYTAIVPEEIQSLIDEIEGKIISGELEVSSAYNMTTEEVVALRESMA